MIPGLPERNPGLKLANTFGVNQEVYVSRLEFVPSYLGGALKLRRTLISIFDNLALVFTYRVLKNS